MFEEVLGSDNSLIWLCSVKLNKMDARHHSKECAVPAESDLLGSVSTE
jgi:hypothetical protein